MNIIIDVPPNHREIAKGGGNAAIVKFGLDVEMHNAYQPMRMKVPTGRLLCSVHGPSSQKSSINL